MFIFFTFAVMIICGQPPILELLEIAIVYKYAKNQSSWKYDFIHSVQDSRVRENVEAMISPVPLAVLILVLTPKVPL